MLTKDKAAGLGTTAASRSDCISTTQGAQRELFGLTVRADDRTTTSAPGPRCGAIVAVVGPGSGPHFASLRCLCGHHLGWLPKPRRRA
jgi:hypothetical protein